jgi:ATP-dependent DNA ligase
LKSGETSKPITTEPYLVEGKNTGKKNETSDEEQASLEFDSMCKKQRDKGYTEAGVKSKVLSLPMLAQKFQDSSHRIEWPAFVQRKYNGMRCLYDGKKAWSRGGKDILATVFKHLEFDTKGYITDGEIILKGNPALQTTISAVKKYRPELSENLEYHIYDIVDETLPFSARTNIVQDLVKAANNPFIIDVPTYTVETPQDVIVRQVQFVKEGFEGTIIRNKHGKYHIGQRSADLQKFKDFQDAEFKIVDVVEGGGSFSECAIFVCDNGKGILFNCVPEGTIELKKEYFKNRKKLIGQNLTIRFFEMTNDKIPQFPVGVSIREEGD